MSVESDIATAIATQVGGRLAPRERQVVTARPTTNPEAYDHVLRGDFFLARRNGADARRAVTEYEQATTLDPRFARAWAHLALAWYLFVDWDWPHPGLTREAAIWLAEKGVINIGVDNVAIDHADDSEFSGHVVCGEYGIVNTEGLTNLDKVVGQRFLYFGLPLRIRNGTGSPIRAVAVLGL